MRVARRPLLSPLRPAVTTIAVFTLTFLYIFIYLRFMHLVMLWCFRGAASREGVQPESCGESGQYRQTWLDWCSWGHTVPHHYPEHGRYTCCRILFFPSLLVLACLGWKQACDNVLFMFLFCFFCQREQRKNGVSLATRRPLTSETWQ